MFFKQMLEQLEVLEKRAWESRLYKISNGLCVACGEPTGVEPGFTRIWCEGCVPAPEEGNMAAQKIDNRGQA